MNYYLRFLCYEDPTRQRWGQIHPDILIDEPARFSYSEPLRIGEDNADRTVWPTYRVAHVVHMKEIDDPVSIDKKALLFEVFVAKEDQWENFEFPDVVLEPID